MKTDTGTVPLTLADINEDELTDEQKAIVAQFEKLAEKYCQQVEALDRTAVDDYFKLLKEHKGIDNADAVVQILNETLHQLMQRRYFPGNKRGEIK